jgi:hypothetical protein
VGHDQTNQQDQREILALTSILAIEFLLAVRSSVLILGL